MQLRIHRFLPHTHAEGPGARACIWVQGCPIHCPGCAAPWTWRVKAGRLIEVEELAERILGGPAVEGVTFVGGEPFGQAEALAALATILRKRGLSVVTFTGYEIEMILASSHPGWHELLMVTDLLIDGPYKRDLATVSQPWVGSSNQRYHFLTPRYEQLVDKLAGIPNKLEIRLSRDGGISVNGLAQRDTVTRLFDGLARTETPTHHGEHRY